MGKCDSCRFCWKSNGLASFKHCGAMRKAYGADEGKCITRKYRCFEPILQVGMQVRIRACFIDDFNALFNPESVFRNHFELTSLSEEGELEIESGDALFAGVPRKMIMPIQTKSGMIETATKEVLHLNCRSITAGFRLQDGATYPKLYGSHYNTAIFDDVLPPKNQMEKYEFRGDLNIEMIVNSAIEDKKRSFVVMGKNISVVGILKNRKKPLQEQKKLQTKQIVDVSGPYDICEVYPYDVNSWIKILKQEKIDFEKNIKKQNRKIKKQLAKRIKNKTKAERFQVFTF